jgi:protein arginine kinase activator
MGKQCQSCGKREAKIHFTEIKDGKKTELHICENCAHEKNMVLAFPSLLSHIMKGGEAEGKSGADAVPAACPQCGMTYTDFKAKGRLGCPDCYNGFKPVLLPLLEKVHGKQRHAGSAPTRLESTLESRRELENLEEELRSAIELEEYEKAAKIRDQIRGVKAAGAAEQGTASES